LTQDGLKEVARDVANTFTTKVTGNGPDQESGMVASSRPTLPPNGSQPSDRGNR
jgi:hypothetical protein